MIYTFISCINGRIIRRMTLLTITYRDPSDTYYTTLFVKTIEHIRNYLFREATFTVDSPQNSTSVVVIQREITFI